MASMAARSSYGLLLRTGKKGVLFWGSCAPRCHRFYQGASCGPIVGRQHPNPRGNSSVDFIFRPPNCQVRSRIKITSALEETNCSSFSVQSPSKLNIERPRDRRFSYRINELCSTVSNDTIAATRLQLSFAVTEMPLHLKEPDAAHRTSTR